MPDGLIFPKPIKAKPRHRPGTVVRSVAGVAPIIIEVLGTPRPQGSLRLFRAKSGHEVARYADTVYEWRGIVTAAVRAAYDGPLLEGAVALSATFELARPRGHSGTGRNAGTIRPAAPLYPTTAPDTDKLLRCVCDAITDAANVWRDDAQVVRMVGSKCYATDDSVPGVTLIITAVRD